MLDFIVKLDFTVMHITLAIGKNLKVMESYLSFVFPLNILSSANESQVFIYSFDMKNEHLLMGCRHLS